MSNESEQYQLEFARLVERLRCYGDHCPFPACGPSSATPPRTQRALQQKDTSHTPRPAKAHDVTIARLHQACAVLKIPPRAAEFAQQLFRHFFKPISLPRTFGDKHKAGIAACIWASCSEHKLTIVKDNVCLTASAKVEHFQVAHGQLQKSYAKFRNRYFRGKLRAKAPAKGAVYDHNARRRRRRCGRDVTGELRTRIFLTAS
ncbi:uncharacterized protein Z519_06793 [Cladophialophora bantiana CBS 173.52]|uniref:Uncharacterized protein n=1 Tax=Cladophialophora bantiana (strain ATCC 10958 / CBS 173.52 / CDC B-1940 / NIH 8579) TaxID=1442370 RepID=A0A0D2I813_CLAB1|nr:uncharacterized protein Z519_06793 [Cladophialophora bantiana CBS 173.52]KIW92944.1 hypothetical protein Z519_06793 [Cladophialophora bantiana CBS 173.52]